MSYPLEHQGSPPHLALSSFHVPGYHLQLSCVINRPRGNCLPSSVTTNSGKTRALSPPPCLPGSYKDARGADARGRQLQKERGRLPPRRLQQPHESGGCPLRSQPLALTAGEASARYLHTPVTSFTLKVSQKSAAQRAFKLDSSRPSCHFWLCK